MFVGVVYVAIKAKTRWAAGFLLFRQLGGSVGTFLPTRRSAHFGVLFSFGLSNLQSSAS